MSTQTARERAVRPSVRQARKVGVNPEQQLWIKFKNSGDMDARNRLIEMYLPQVQYISERLLTTLPRSIELDDLRSAGTFGLMDAIDGFDMSRGIKFKTYCTMRIRGSILDELRSQDWVPRLVRLQANRLARAFKTLEGRLGREPSDQELAEELRIPVDELRGMQDEASVAAIFSLSDKFSDGSEDGGLENEEVIVDSRVETPVQILCERDQFEHFCQGLSTKEKRILVLYYYEGLTMKEIGRIVDLTESRVCQIHSTLMEQLRGKPSAKSAAACA